MSSHVIIYFSQAPMTDNSRKLTVSLYKFNNKVVLIWNKTSTQMKLTVSYLK